MASARPVRSALEEFLPEVDLQRNAQDIRVDPREIHLEPVGLVSESVLTSHAQDNPAQAQLWPMLAAALVGIGVTLLGSAAYSTFEGL